MIGGGGVREEVVEVEEGIVLGVNIGTSGVTRGVEGAVINRVVGGRIGAANGDVTDGFAGGKIGAAKGATG